MPASKVQYEKVCPVCGKRFKAKTLYSVVCSDACRYKAGSYELGRLFPIPGIQRTQVYGFFLYISSGNHRNELKQ